MKTIKKTIGLILALVVIVSAFCVVLFGCGASDKDESTTENTTASTTQKVTETQQKTTEKKAETTKKVTEATTQATTHASASDTSFEGEWSDSYSQRAYIKIEKSENEYKVKITWSSSAFESTSWDMKAKLADNGKELYYTDCVKKTRTYTSETDFSDKVEYNNGSGTFYIKDGKLYWNDKVEDAGKDTSFIKI